MLTFAQPFWLAAGLLTCCGAALFIGITTARRKKELKKFAAPHLLPLLTANVSQIRRRMKSILLLTGAACLFAALARPQYGSILIEVRRKGIDILIGFDVSKSMLAPDIKPNRLQRAKLAVRDFTAKLDGDRLGLLPFAGTSFLMCPLTTDYDAFNASLDALDVKTIPKGGTKIGKVIQDAGRVLAKEANRKILILITDGEDLSQDALKAAEEAKQEKMTIYTVGVGMPEGELVPLPEEGPGQFVKDERGEFVTSKLDEKILAAVAQTTGGIYVPLGSMGQGLDTVYERKLALIPKEEKGQRKRKVPVERFQWPLGTAILLLSADFLLIGRRRALRFPFFITTAGRRKRQQATAIGILLCCMFFRSASSAWADEGHDLFQAGSYSKAAALYQNALKENDDPVLHFNLGSCLHKLKKYAEAEKEFSSALKTDDLALQAKSYYNRGISQYNMGKAAEAANVEQAIQHFRRAEKSFAAAAKLQPQNKRNIEPYLKDIKKKLEELEKKQQEQQRSGQQCKNPNSGQKNKDDRHSASSDQKQEKNGGEEKNRPGENKKDETKQEKNDAVQEPKKQRQHEVASESDKQRAEQAAESLKNAQAEKQPQTDVQQNKQAEGHRMTGVMTQEEAKNLLNSLKSEQGELNFMPQEAADSESVGRDW